MIASLLKRNVGILLITCFVLGVFALQSPFIAEAQTNTNPDADAAETSAFGAGPDGFTNTNRTSTEDDNSPVSVGERLKLTGWNLTIFNIFSSLGAMIAWLGGSLFDAIINVFVVGMYKISEDFGLNVTINAMWGIIRDVFNLLFIFGLIFSGFKLILGMDDSGSKKMIGSIIVAALLINFSLYAAQIVVDFSNVVAYQINTLIQPPETAETTVVLGDWIVPNISTSFTQLTNLDKLGEGSDEMAKKAGLGVDTPGAAMALGLLFTVFYSVLGFVFAAGAFIMFSRFIILIFLMIFSPIMFLGFIFPNFKSYSSQWGKLLINQALVGPAFLFMLYLSLQALSGLSSLSASQFTVTNLTIYLLIVTAFLWGSLMVARSMSNWGAFQAVNVGDRLGKMTSGFVGRNTVGRVADRYNRSLEEKGVSDKSWRRSAASSLAGNKFGGSYSRSDARSSDEKAAQKGARRAQVQKINSAITAGSSPAATRNQIIKMEEAITGASNDQLIEMLGKHKEGSIEYKKIVENMSASQFDAVMKAKPEELDDKAKEKLAEKRGAHVTAAVTGPGGIGIKNADESQLKMLGEEAITNNILELKQSQFDKMMDSKDYTTTQKDRFKKARKDGLINEFGTGVTETGVAEGSKAATFFATYGGNDKAVAKLPEEILKSQEAAEHLRSSALRQMLHDGLDVNTRALIRANISRSSNADAKKWLTPAGRNSSSEGQLF